MRAHLRTPILLAFLGALFLLGTAGAREKKELTPSSRDYDQKHIRLDVQFDFSGRSVSGSCHITLTPLRDGFDRVLFHSNDTTVRDVRVRGEGETKAAAARSFRMGEGLLEVDLGRTFSKGQEITLEMDYTSTPTRGLYFFSPTETHPEIPTQVWSQGEARNNHHWFPCYDEPDDRITSELIAHVPAEMEVISNGTLRPVTRSEDGKTATYHFTQEQSHVPYLVSVIAGEFDHQVEDWEGVPLHTYVPKGMGDLVETTFGQTPEMMAFFSEYTGQRYPYPRYSQTTVWEFTHGGMENTTATTLNLRALHDERAHIDYSADGLIAHELSHQWFGDLITCREWKEMWLNEGFATYFTDLFFEQQEGSRELLIRRRGSAEGWTRGSTPARRQKMREERAEEEKKTGRSLARIPLELPKGNNYGKGASVLHILRRVMGDDKFREGIRRYVARRKDTCVTSEQLREDLEAVHGKSLQAVFDEWVYGAGYPILEVEWKWLPQEKTGLLLVKQTQDETAGLFHVPATIAFHRESPQGLETLRKEIIIGKPEEEFRFSLETEPLIVRFDEGDWIPKKLNFPKGLEALTVQALRDPDVTGRLDAVDALGDLKADAVPALARVLGEDPEEAVRQAAASRLARMEASDVTRQALLGALEDDSAMVRSAAAGGLGAFAPAEVEDRLITLLAGDPSWAVQAAAARSLGRCKSAKAKEPLLEALSRKSYRNGVEVAAMAALADIGDVSALPAVIEAVTAMTDALGGSSVRGGAIRSMVRLGAGDPRTRELLTRLLDHPSRWTRLAAARSLRKEGTLETIPTLLAKAASEENEGVKGSLEETVKAIVEAVPGAAPGERSITDLAAAADALEKEAKRKALEARLAELMAERARLEVEIQKLRDQLKGDTPAPTRSITR